MSWVAQVHEKARILLAQVEPLRAVALQSGIDPSAAVSAIFEQLEQIYSTEYPLARAMEESDLLFHIEGPALHEHLPRLSLIETVFQNIRAQVFAVAKAVAGLGDGKSISDKDVDLSLSALAPGSLYVGIRAQPPIRRDGQLHVFGETDTIVEATKEAMRSIRVVSRFLDAEANGAVEAVPDAAVRDAALVAVARLAPSRRSGIASITISGSTVGAPTGGGTDTVLTPKLRNELRRQLRSETRRGPVLFTVLGEVREVDLDFLRFELRPTGQSDGARVRCHIPSGVAISLEALAGRRVEVMGVSASNDSESPRMLTVRSLRTLDGSAVFDTELSGLPLPGPGSSLSRS